MAAIAVHATYDPTAVAVEYHKIYADGMKLIYGEKR